MTEAEWLACEDPRRMLEFLRGKASDRKLRLLAVACCRSIWQLLTDERSRKAVELAERSADHHVDPKTLDSVSAEAEEAFEDAITNDEADAADRTGPGPDQLAAACSAASYASNSPVVRDSDCREVMEAAAEAAFDCAAERAAQARIMRDIFGNPFRPNTPDPCWFAWNGGTVADLARAIYADRAFDRLPILADAVEDAGCTDRTILDHCRSGGPHVRGCWVIDLLLGKE